MTRRRTIAIGAVLIDTSGLALARLTPPPLLLSLLDGVMGDGVGTEKAGSAISLGTNGRALDVWHPLRNFRICLH